MPKEMTLSKDELNSIKNRGKRGGNVSTLASSVKDAYFTSNQTASFCVSILEDMEWITSNSVVLEPACGKGALTLPIKSDVKIIKQDILDYSIDGTTQIVDYLTSTPTKVDLVFTNPPFGPHASLAIKFFERATKDTDRIAMILPKSFRKISVIDRLNKDFWPVRDYDLPSENYTLPDGTLKTVKTCFQLWERKPFKRPKLSVSVPTDVIGVGDRFTLRTQGSNAGKVLDGFGHSSGTSAIINADINAVRRLDLSTLASFTAATPSIGMSELHYALELQAKNDINKLNNYLSKGAIALLDDLLKEQHEPIH